MHDKEECLIPFHLDQEELMMSHLPLLGQTQVSLPIELKLAPYGLRSPLFVGPYVIGTKRLTN